ncbi:MAG: heme lyase CcmF/NrfE family subunit [Gammaproteobacteria bacterium]|nr:heme lyase CcmF/NrfE family subunit [Gammaproteobacteria bacterium]
MIHSLLGQGALWFAFAVAMAQVLLAWRGLKTQPKAAVTQTRWLAFLFVIVIGVAFFVLMHALVTHEFVVKYVADHSSKTQPLFYRIAAVWGGHEGSLLLWLGLLGGWGWLSLMSTQALPTSVILRMSINLGLLSAVFILFTALTSNPFVVLERVPIDGLGLNPLLQDPGQVMHPPMLYAGYVGFVIPFVFSLAILPEKQLERAWLSWLRTWGLLAWMLLTIGIVLGSWWAYRELGWGGYWFWDPVENASLMPWLVATAMIHSIVVASRRGLFLRWTVLLAISTFCLCIIGFFLVRSGVLISVHAFATDPSRGRFILAILAGVLLTAAWLYGRYGRYLKNAAQASSGKIELRDQFLLINNVLLAAAAGVVILGTLYPLVLEVFTGNRISVGPPYFNRAMAIPVIPLLIAMGIGTVMTWRTTAIRELRFSLLVMAAITIALTVLLFFASGRSMHPAWLGIICALWVAVSVLFDVVTQFNKKQSRPWGLWVPHFGLALLIFGVSVDTATGVTREARLGLNQFETVGHWTFALNNVAPEKGPNYLAYRGEVDANLPSMTYRLYPEKRVYRQDQPAMTEAAIQSLWWGDVFVALGEPYDDGSWSARILLKPMIWGVWLGGGLMAFGGLLAVVTRRRKPVAAP